MKTIIQFLFLFYNIVYFILDIIPIKQYCLCEMEVSNIGQIQAQIMSFEKDTEEELSKMAKHSGIKFSFY